MAKQTDSQAIREILSAVLKKQGIDDLALEIRLTEVIKDYFELRVKFEPGDIKARILESLGVAAKTAFSIDSVAERWSKSFRGHRPNWDEREWNDFAKFIISEEQKGKMLETYASWYSGQFKTREGIPFAPSTKPQIHRQYWDMAFSTEKQLELSAMSARSNGDISL